MCSTHSVYLVSLTGTSLCFQDQVKAENAVVVVGIVDVMEVEMDVVVVVTLEEVRVREAGAVVLNMHNSNPMTITPQRDSLEEEVDKDTSHSLKQ